MYVCVTCVCVPCVCTLCVSFHRTVKVLSAQGEAAGIKLVGAAEAYVNICIRACTDLPVPISFIEMKSSSRSDVLNVFSIQAEECQWHDRLICIPRKL